MLLSLATTLNSVPLPPVSNRYGIRLPPPEHCLTNVNFAIVPDAPRAGFGESIVQPEVAENSQQQNGDRATGEAPAQRRKRALDEDEDYD